MLLFAFLTQLFRPRLTRSGLSTFRFNRNRLFINLLYDTFNYQSLVIISHSGRFSIPMISLFIRLLLLLFCILIPFTIFGSDVLEFESCGAPLRIYLGIIELLLLVCFCSEGNWATTEAP